jgi:hypothetical protein
LAWFFTHWFLFCAIAHVTWEQLGRATRQEHRRKAAQEVERLKARYWKRRKGTTGGDGRKGDLMGFNGGLMGFNGG